MGHRVRRFLFQPLLLITEYKPLNVVYRYPCTYCAIRCKVMGVLTACISCACNRLANHPWCASDWGSPGHCQSKWHSYLWNQLGESNLIIAHHNNDQSDYMTRSRNLYNQKMIHQLTSCTLLTSFPNDIRKYGTMKRMTVWTIFPVQNTAHWDELNGFIRT